MGIITDSYNGPNYIQPNEPNDTTLGKLWWNSTAKQLQGANGVRWLDPAPPPPAIGTGGYMGGSNTMNKMTFSSETVIAHSSTFVRAQVGVSSLIAGYSFGSTGDNSNIVGKLTFSTGLTSNLVATMNEPINSNGACDSGSAGYRLSGDVNTFVGVATNKVDKLTFSSETLAFIASTTTPTANNFNVGTESSTKGYNNGGRWMVPFYTSVQSLTFSTDAINNVANTLGSSHVGGVGINGAGNGYICGGQDNLTLIDKMVFASEAISVLSSTLNPGRYGGAAVNAIPHGYVCGGVSNTTIEKMIFATDAFSVISATLAVVGVPYTWFGCEDLN